MQYQGMFHLLLVEDNPADIRLLKEALRHTTAPHELHVTVDGEDALDFLWHRGSHEAAPRPSLILLDLNLPRKGGHEVLSELKGDASLREIPVIVFSSSNEIDDVDRAYKLHANCYVQKPSDLEESFKVMRTIENFWMRVAELTPGAAVTPSCPEIVTTQR